MSSRSIVHRLCALHVQQYSFRVGVKSFNALSNRCRAAFMPVNSAVCCLGNRNTRVGVPEKKRYAVCGHGHEKHLRKKSPAGYGTRLPQRVPDGTALQQHAKQSFVVLWRRMWFSVSTDSTVLSSLFAPCYECNRLDIVQGTRVSASTTGTRTRGTRHSHWLRAGRNSGSVYLSGTRYTKGLSPALHPYATLHLPPCT